MADQKQNSPLDSLLGELIEGVGDFFGEFIGTGGSKPETPGPADAAPVRSNAPAAPAPPPPPQRTASKPVIVPIQAGQVPPKPPLPTPAASAPLSPPTAAAPAVVKTGKSLTGKVALVTGSTSGIGLGIARALAAEGASIILNGFASQEEIDAVTAGIKEFGVRAIYLGADVSNASQVDAMIKVAIDQMGSLDIVVNNAGIQFTAPIEDFPVEKWNAIIGINLSSAFFTMKNAVPAMKARRWGRIINISSAHGLVGSATKVAYVAAKHGLIGMTKVAGIELANDGITCNAICPGWVLTPMVQKQIEDRAARNGTTVDQEKIALVGEKQPMKKFSTPESIGALCVFLCSEHASTMTGAALSVDGGWVAG